MASSADASVESDVDSAIDLTEEPDGDWESLVPDKKKYDYLAKSNFFKLKGAKKNEKSNNTSIIFDCMKCIKKTSISCSDNSTGNLLKHVKRKHAPEISKFESARKRHRSGLYDLFFLNLAHLY